MNSESMHRGITLASAFIESNYTLIGMDGLFMWIHRHTKGFILTNKGMRKTRRYLQSNFSKGTEGSQIGNYLGKLKRRDDIFYTTSKKDLLVFAEHITNNTLDENTIFNVHKLINEMMRQTDELRANEAFDLILQYCFKVFEFDSDSSNNQAYYVNDLLVSRIMSATQKGDIMLRFNQTKGIVLKYSVMENKTAHDKTTGCVDWKETGTKRINVDILFQSLETMLQRARYSTMIELMNGRGGVEYGKERESANEL